MTVVAIHQPNYIPYIGFFNKMSNCDIFVIFDNAQFSRKDWTHRNRIRIYNGWKWLTIPVAKDEVSISDIRIRNDLRIHNVLWTKYHWRQIYANYVRSNHFWDYEAELHSIYSKSYIKLFDVNMELIRFLIKSFHIKAKVILSSQLKIENHSYDCNLDFVKAVGGDTYLSGAGGHDYLDVRMFEKAGIKVIFQDFKCPTYEQRYSGFIPNLSAIDLLLNEGEESCMLAM
jgi:hypothetical protein